MGRVSQTINNEMNRGTITQLKRQTQNEKTYDTCYSVYDADSGQAFYEKQRLNCGRHPKCMKSDVFIVWVDDKILNEKWLLDAVVGFARKHELFNFTVIPGTTALCQWIDRGIIRTKNMNVLEKLSRRIKAIRPGHRPNKRILGT